MNPIDIRHGKGQTQGNTKRLTPLLSSFVYLCSQLVPVPIGLFFSPKNFGNYWKSSNQNPKKICYLIYLFFKRAKGK